MLRRCSTRVAWSRSVDAGTLVGIVVALVALWAFFLAVFWVLRPQGVSVRELLGVIRDVVRLVLVGLLAWIVSPIDLIPEFIPVLGPLDDVVVAIVAMRYVRRRLGIDDLRRRWAGTDTGFELVLRVLG